MPRFAVKLRLALSLLLLSPTLAAAQSTVLLGESRSIRSTILDEERELLVSLPESYHRSAIRYPVLYVLDGGSHFLHATAAVRFLSSARHRIPEMIVVAVPNSDRNRDLTPGEGGDRFRRFLAEELFPFVDSAYRAAPHRVLAGHSRSGLFVVDVLMRKPELVDGYIAASPALWRLDEAALRDGEAAIGRGGRSLLLTLGERENDKMREGLDRFREALQAGADSSLRWSYVDLADEDHASTPYPTLYRGLNEHFRGYQLPALAESLAELEANGGVRGLEAHFERQAARFGVTAAPPEELLREIGRLFVEAGEAEQAGALFDRHGGSYPATAELGAVFIARQQVRSGSPGAALATLRRAVRWAPRSSRLHAAIGDASCAGGDPAGAREAYRQAAGFSSGEHAERLAARAREGCAAGS